MAIQYFTAIRYFIICGIPYGHTIFHVLWNTKWPYGHIIFHDPWKIVWLYDISGSMEYHMAIRYSTAIQYFMICGKPYGHMVFHDPSNTV